MEYKYHNNRMRSKIQAGLVLQDSTWTWFENLCYSSNLRSNFQFKAIRHQQTVVKTSRKWSHCHSITHIQGVPGGMCQTSGGCSLC